MFALMAWLQLATSIVLAAAIVWGYVTYQASFGHAVQSVAASINAISETVVRTAETVESRGVLLDQSGQMLVETGKLIKELRVVAENQAKIAPQYAEGVRHASFLIDNVSRTFQKIGNVLLTVKLPTLGREGWKPNVSMTRPLEGPAQSLIENAQHIKVVSEGLAGVATTISSDGQNLGKAVIATSEQALKVIAEAERILGRLKTQDLPKAIENLRTTSSELSKVSAQVNVVGNIGIVLLIVGLIVAVWCFLNSLGMLMMAKAQGSDSSGRASG